MTKKKPVEKHEEKESVRFFLTDDPFMLAPISKALAASCILYTVKAFEKDGKTNYRFTTVAALTDDKRKAIADMIVQIANKEREGK